MKKHVVLAAFVFAIFSCTGNTVAPIAAGESSSLDGSSGALSSSGGTSSGTSSSGVSGSSGAGGSSSSYSALPDVDSTLIDGPTGLQVSSIAGPRTLVLTWTDIPSLPRTSYLGYQVWRNDNYGGWSLVGVAPPQKQFFKDTSLSATGEYMYLYRIIAYDTTGAGADTVISKFSAEAGTPAVTELGFGGIVFDNPSAFTITRWGPSLFELKWNISALKPELGVVVQKLSTTSSKPPFISNGTSWLVSDSTSDWKNLDTLGENNNHFFVYDSNAFGTYRIYAFYSNEFGRIISEFSTEVSTAEAKYHTNVTFEAPDNYTKILDSNTIVASWSQTHNTFIERANALDSFALPVLNGADTAYYEIEQYVSDSKVKQFELAFDQIQFVNDSLSYSDVHYHLCAYAYRIRVFWKDQWNQVDRTQWSPLSGTSGGTVNLADPASYCP
jgi:hypothetical protein